jgi:voltage-gated potassium channel
MRRRIWFSLILLVVVVGFGTFGFYLVETNVHHDIFSAFYFTLETMFTVGYGDIIPSSDISRAIAVFVIIGGVTAAITTVQSFFDLAMTKDLRRSLGLPERRTKMKDHYIICGFGNVGRLVYEQLKQKGDSFLVIERDQRKVEDMVDEGIPVISGDAGDENVLRRANIKEARTLITTLPDSANIIVSIQAKMLNPNVFVVSEVEDFRNSVVLKRAGADEIVHCHEMGARVMVSKARRVAIDPVCGAEVDPLKASFIKDFEGEKFYFDSKECLDAFEKNPRRFMEMKRIVDATCGVK